VSDECGACTAFSDCKQRRDCVAEHCDVSEQLIEFENCMTRCSRHTCLGKQYLMLNLFVFSPNQQQFRIYGRNKS
jgi:hypothetical protein